ncbi:MAG: Lipid A 1-diphosphate synthase [Stenotrophomonas maltophilia]|nr:MAG: Lipid A 1-diphosphate synthase [Stenotrophomonas maltophilia]
MEKASPFQATWSWRPFIACHLLALLLLVLWLWAPTRAAMDQFDFGLFHLLNAPLASNEAWRNTWAVASTRPFDALVGVILLFLMIRGDWIFEATQVRRATFGLVVTMLVLMVVRTLYAKLAHHMGWQHASISSIAPDAVRLEDFFRNWQDTVLEVKDESARSFPGDHASVLLIWGLFLTLYARTVVQWVVIWGLTLLFMLPRLVAGAHWGQDDYIGGVQMALIALAWGCFTPFAGWASAHLVRLTEPLFRLAAKIPLLNRLSVIRA